MKAFRFVKEIITAFPLLLAANTILIVFLSVVDLLSMFSIAPIFDLFIGNDRQNSISGIGQKIIDTLVNMGIPISLGSLIVIFIFINAFRSCLAIVTQYLTLKIKYTVLKTIMIGTYGTFFKAKWHFFTEQKIGTLLNSFTREIEVVGSGLGAMAEFFGDVIKLSIYVVAPFYISWKVTGISLVTAFVFIVPFFYIGKYSRRLGQLNTSTSNSLVGMISEGLMAAKIILGFANQKKTVDNLSLAYDAQVSVSIKSQTLGYSIAILYYPLGIIVIAVTIYAGKILSLPPAEIAVIAVALFRILPTIGHMASRKNSLENFFPSFEQIIGLKRNAEELIQPSGKVKFSGLQKEIRLKNLSFSYPGHTDILKNVSLTIPKESMIAIVGGSGAGKSTLIDLIMGLCQPTAGNIQIDDTILQEFDIQSYRKRIGYVPQDSILFNMTIKDNLLWAKAGSSDQEIREACVQANALEFIEKLPEQFDTVVGDRGVRLSGGQIQRIALARSVLRTPDLLILDEATSSLDTQSERLIQDALEKISRETTVLAVAHRLSTIVNADCIYIMDCGRIVEEGTYSQLLNNNGPFAKMVALQNLRINPEGAETI